VTALVTGATGFLGGALVAELTRRGCPVRILARDCNRARHRLGESVEVVRGDITDGPSVRQAVEGVSTIFHLAGRLYHPSVPAAVYQRTHVEGTRTLLEACRGRSRLRCLVHVSTTGVYGVTGEQPAAEDAPFAPTNPYEATKLAAELLAVEAWQQRDLPVTVVRPALVYGPGDLHLLDFVAAIDRGLFRVIDGGRSMLHPVYIDDLVTALLLSAESSQALGRSYNIASERPVTVRELATAIARALGRELPPTSIPLWLANLGSDLFALIPGMRGERAPLTRSRVEFLTRSRIYDVRRARTELGYAPRIELEKGMQLTTQWYRSNRYLDRPSPRRDTAP
jgi:nucleoside-diphosphate-sugar epimerase